MAFPVQFANLTNATGAQLDGNFNALSANAGSALIGFLPTGTGAVSTTVDKQLNTYKLLSNFLPNGYVKDGSVDYTAQLATALTSCAVLGQGLLIDDGIWLTQPFVVPTTLPALRGINTIGATIKLKPGIYSAGQRMIDARNNSVNLFIGDFALSVNDVSFNSTWSIDLTGGNHISCRNILITGSGANGIIFQGGTDIKVSSVRITGTNGGFGCGVYGNTQVSTGYQYTAEDVICYGIFNFAIQFGGAGVFSSEFHLITRCRSEGNIGASFAFSLARCNYSMISECFSKNSNHEAFQLTDTFYCSIIACHGEWTGTNGIDFGISVNGTSNQARFNKIIGNTLINTFEEGIAVADWSQYNLIADNLCRDCGIRFGRGAFIAYTVTAGAQCINNNFRNNEAVNESGGLVNYFSESTSGGGGALTDGTIAADNTFRGSISGAKYSMVGATSVVFDPEWVTWTPTITSGAGAITSYTINSAMYLLRGREVHIQFDFTITNNGTGASSVNMTLPFTAVTNGGSIGGRESIVSGNSFMGDISGGAVSFFTYNNGYPGATNARLVGSGIMRI